MKILMKKRSFVKVEMAGLLGVKVPCLMPNRVKVSKSRKQILKFSFEPKNEQKYFCISALVSKKRSNQKIRALYTTN